VTSVAAPEVNVQKLAKSNAKVGRQPNKNKFYSSDELGQYRGEKILSKNHISHELLRFRLEAIVSYHFMSNLKFLGRDKCMEHLKMISFFRFSENGHSNCTN